MLSLSGILISVPAILIAITIHEFSHGYAAHSLGDPTPQRQGRLTLNPLAHLDLLGTLMLLVAYFGWAKPVQVNPFFFKGNRQRGMLIVALAGPLSNLVVALLGAILYNLLGKTSYYLSLSLNYLVLINVYLAVFNLIPVPPLDGSKILASLVPQRYHEYVYPLEAYGPFILMFLIITRTTGKLLGPMAGAIIELIYNISAVITGA